MVHYIEEKRIVLNLTGKPVVAYDSEGCLVELTPTESSETELASDDGIKRKAVRLVTGEHYRSLTKNDLAEADYAYIASYDRGRNNIRVVRLERRVLVNGEERLYRVFPVSSRDHQAIDGLARYQHTIDG